MSNRLRHRIPLRDQDRAPVMDGRAVFTACILLVIFLVIGNAVAGLLHLF